MTFSSKINIETTKNSINDEYFLLYPPGHKSHKVKNWISKTNRKEILWFVAECEANNISHRRQAKYISNIRSILRLCPFELQPMDIEVLKNVVNKIQSSDYGVKTKVDFKTFIKKYYKLKNDDELPKSLKFIKTTIKANEDDKRRKIPTENDVKKLIKVCRNLRDKAIIAVFFDTGPRIGELGPLKVENVVYDDYGIKLMIHGKTGTRPIRLKDSEPYVRSYMAMHPYKDNPKAPLWIDYNKKQMSGMTYGSMRMMLRKKAIKAGVDVGKVKPHNFRHADTFNRIKSGMPERLIIKQKGWSGKTKMIDTYSNLTHQDVDDYELEASGKKKKKDTKSVLAPVECPRCNRMNMQETDVCICGMPLTKRKAAEMEELRQSEMERMFEDLVNKRIDEKLAGVLKKQPTETDRAVESVKSQLKKDN